MGTNHQDKGCKHYFVIMSVTLGSKYEGKIIFISKELYYEKVFSYNIEMYNNYISVLSFQ